LNASVEKVFSSSTNLSIDIIPISTNSNYLLSCWVNKPLLLIFTHNLIIELISNGSTMAFGAYVFIVSLKKHICKSKRLAFKGSTTYSNEDFTFSISQ
jgi:hypothetical protein